MKPNKPDTINNSDNSNNFAVISKIIESSFIDGPGHRMVIFFQGCSLNCIYCHNPETKGICKKCFQCVRHCPTNALNLNINLLSKNNQINFNESRCQKCDLCIKECPSSSNPHAYAISVSDLIQKITLEKDFIDGITLSGGEVSLSAPFVYNLFTAIKKIPSLNKLTLFIDTNGYNKKIIFNKLSSITDGFIFDLKALDSKIHLKITGRKNKSILENIKLISEKKLLYEIRTVFIEGLNDSEEEISNILNFIAQLNDYTLFKIIPFRPAGVRGELKDCKPYTNKKIEEIKTRANKILGTKRISEGK